ncbi:MAG: SH3 domain-containing protein, partial [Caldilineaceae bacterium]|nr:SH3 domain-containing protein [Caldilineaceae bacterium]
MNRKSFNSAVAVPAPVPTRPRVVLLLLLGLAAMVLSGCLMQPIVAGPLRQAPLPSDQGPIIAIAPIAAASGDTVSVSGAGWEANEVIFVNLEGQQGGELIQATVATGTADDEGRFYLGFVVPLEVFWQDVIDLQVVAYSLATGEKAAAPFGFVSVTVTPDASITAPAPVTPTPLAPADGYGVAIVSSRGLNMRSGPGTVFPVIRALTRGTPVNVLGQDRSGLWLYGQLLDGTLGWMARAYTNYLGDPPVVPAPPTPIYRPTATATPRPHTPTPGLGWQGEYYANPSLQGSPRVVREDAAIDFNWEYNAPAPGIPTTGFSVRWFRDLYFSAGTYRLFGQSDGGVRVWVDGNLVLDRWSGVNNGTYSVELWLGQGSHTFFIDYGQRSQPARMSFWWEQVGGPTATPVPGFPDWRGEYFGNRDLAGNPVFVRNDRAVDFNWSWISPGPGIGTENYSVRWTRTIDFSSGDYRFFTRSDDGIRVYVDGHRIIDEWRDMGGNTTYTADRYLSGHKQVVVEYYQHTGPAFVYFWWERLHRTPTATPTRTPTPTPTPPVTNPFADASPSSGPTGTQITVSYGGFPPNTAVNLLLGAYVRAAQADAASSTIYATGTSDRFGNGSLSFTLPATWPDGSAIEPGKLTLLVATANFGVSAATDFDVRASRPTVAPNPYVDVNPSSGGPGTQITVRGGGFPANQTVDIYLAGVVRASEASAVPPIVSRTTDGNGNFTAGFAMPATWPDGSAIATGKIIVLAATSGFGVQASDSFDFFATPPNPSISLSPTSGGAGARVTAAGAGFPANAPVAVYLATLDTAVGRGATQQYVSGMTDASGRYSLAFTMPATWPDGGQVTQDKIVVTVATPDFSVSASSVFAYLIAGPTATPTQTPTPTNTPPVAPTATPNPYAQVSPGSGTAGTPVTVSGGGFPPNTTLFAHIATMGGSVGSGSSYARFASAPTNAAGDYTMLFVMPATWPNGSQIATQRLVVVIAPDDFAVEASTTFSYQQVTTAGDADPTITATSTPTRVPPTATNTATPVPPTATNTVAPTATPTSTSTNTPVPPTATATSTPEPPAATPTPEPPTETPTTLPDPPTATPTDTPEPTATST